MKIAAIISEYNPLHNGHIYHINRTRRETSADAVISVMSGNFVQRGLPALIDKWKRADYALNNGIDLVIELPVLYSLSSAEFFAFGAVSLLNSLGVVDILSFGSECGNVKTLQNFAKILSNEPKEISKDIKFYLSEGMPYPSARSKALSNYIEQNKDKSFEEPLNNLFNSSNNILGIEYCKSLIKLNSDIKPFSIQREGGAYNCNSLDNIFSSATSIRKYISDNKSAEGLQRHVPEYVFASLQSLISNNYNFVFEDAIVPYVKYKAFSSQNSMENLPDVSEGIHNKIFKTLENLSTHDDIVTTIKSKRYTYTRINRILCQYFVGFEQYDTENLRREICPYARILGFNKTGAEVLKKIKNNSSIPYFTKVPKGKDEVLKLELQATRAYSLLNKSISPISDYIVSPIKI